MPGDPETLNARALALLSDEGLSLPGISVKTSSPKGEPEQLPKYNTGGHRWQNNYKFNPWSIEEIVKSEQSA
ncbi:VOC family protein [Shigella flexneri]